ncbi:uncharacterized protein MAL8P1.12 [Copidosoma floridanum]|uniref:uncharacterized protein MAL8P1.12 n=1 Tax=Copidosoma floridanum TaxID=29053 RepID=UPI0006C98F4E|nr:uncharacterized protein MAL8P1.12 [Copidosoma floridanum]
MVIASNNWIQNVSNINQEKIMSATGILICHDNSYPFQERTLSLEQPIKIGRSVARARAANDNAIFDCKVLSRNHALLWHDSGKFYLKDTKSSNGTFVNNKRLSPSGEESSAFEICSGDVVQFGVDVVESTKKVTHGCIVATLKLYLPDGKEAKASFTNSIAYVNVTLEDLYKLHQLIQEAGRRENALRSKLEYMQQLLESTRIAINQSWKALVLEDCLLSRLETLENQVLAYSKNYGDDQLRMTSINLLEDKTQYQNATKELLQKKVQEKREIVNTIKLLKSRLNESQEETQSLRNTIRNNQNELQELAVKYVRVQQTLEDTTEKLNITKVKLKEIIQQSEKDKQDFLIKLEDLKTVGNDLQTNLEDSKLDYVYVHEQIYALKNYVQTIHDMKLLSDKAYDFKKYAKPVDTINVILNKWNSIYIKVINNQNLINMNDQINLTEKIEKFSNPVGIKDDSKNNDLHGNLLISKHTFCSFSGNKKINFVLNTIPQPKNNILLLYPAKEFSTDGKKESVFRESKSNLSNNYNQNNVLMSNLSNNEKESSDINESKNKELITEYDSEIFCEPVPKTSSKVTKETERIKIIEDILFDEGELRTKRTGTLNKYIFNASKPLVIKNELLGKCSKQFVLQNLVSTKFLPKDYFYANKNIIQELQNLKSWLFYESNDVIVAKLEKYYEEVENETQQLQEINEQLAALKEKYNTMTEEKANIVRKYITLKSQCQRFPSTTFMVSIYYVVPLIVVLIWMLSEKLL